MARALVVAVLAAALAVPAAVSADPPQDGTLSVKRGRGQIVLKLKGTVIGRLVSGAGLTKGRVQIRDFRPFDGNNPTFLGCKPKLRHPSPGITVCQGKKISFRVQDARWTISVRGSGISLSAVGHGSVVVDGDGDLGVNDGVMAFNDDPYQSLPDFPTTFPLEAPTPGG